jgi:hypothetical protein
MLGFYGCKYEHYGSLGCNDMYFGEASTFRRNISPPTSGSRSKLCKILAEADGKLNLLSDPEGGNNIFPETSDTLKLPGVTTHKAAL